MKTLSCHKATIKVAKISKGKDGTTMYRILGNCASLSNLGKGIQEQHPPMVF